VWFLKSQENVLEEVSVSRTTGLSAVEAEQRLTRYGRNQLKEKPKKSLVALFLNQLKDMLIYVLLGASVITVAIGEYVDAIIILIVVVLNAVIGLIQEYKAEKAIEALKKMASPKALVRREGEIREVESPDLVPGDIVLIDAGRYVPADLRLLESVNLQIEESALTGESVPANKIADTVLSDPKTPIGDRCNMAYMSTLTTYGRGEGVVIATGMDTEIGKIAKILDEEINEMTPLQKKLDELGKVIGFLAIGICAIIFVIALFQRRDLFEMFLTAISLAVAAIPEGLAAIVAIVLALGVTRMSKINAIVKRLPAVETLGSVNIVCSDKTGTLTQNKMTVVKDYVLHHEKQIPLNWDKIDSDSDEREMIKTFVLCSDATAENGHETGDPTEIALVVLGNRYGLTKVSLAEKHRRITEKPFDSDRKLMSTVNIEADHYRIHTKGALDNLLKICTTAFVGGKIVPLTEMMKLEYLRVSESMSSQALRILGAAFRDIDKIPGLDEMEQNLTMLGFVGMIDPPRLEVKNSIAEAKTAGITPVMITGDHKNTAVAIAKELGIAESIDQSVTGAEIDEIPEDEFTKNIGRYRVFARVSPEHKIKIVKAFKAHGNIVSMTGDGVNDAPSLKHADIGVAMGITGTDVTKNASDMILTDDNFSTIINAIEEGRNIYNNIKKTVTFLLACNIGEIISVFLSILFFWPVPLIPVQILWINLITDSLPAIALGVDPGDHEVMKKKPRDPKAGFFAEGAGFRVIIDGIIIGLLTLAAFFLGLKENGYTPSASGIPDNALAYARTMAFTVLATSQLFYSLSKRNSKKLVFRIGVFKNMYLIGAIILGILLQLVVISVPFLQRSFSVTNLHLKDWGFVLFFSAVPFLLSELIKFFPCIHRAEQE
jgi:Ca2+-transporting ATPase